MGSQRTFFIPRGSGNKRLIHPEKSGRKPPDSSHQYLKDFPIFITLSNENRVTTGYNLISSGMH